jgi:hypothetical protein
MHIKNDNTDTQRLFDADLMPDDYVVEFSENGVANVREEVGTALVESGKYPTISEHSGGDD